MEAGLLGKPSVSMLMFGKVLNQATGKVVQYDPYAITERMQADMIQYMSEPPLITFGEEGDDAYLEQVVWTNWLKSRQTGASTTIESAGVPLTMYRPGYDFLCIADTDKRASYLHNRAQVTYSKWPEEIRIPQPRKGESLALTFDHGSGEINSKMRTLSGRSAAMGIGQSPDFLHLSEAAFHTDLATQWTMLQPAMANRNHAMVMVECTPAPLTEPSAPWWKDHFFDGLRQTGRFRSKFYPYWDGKLNRRAWPRGLAPSNEELRLLERYGESGLTLDHLFFRRFTMENDRQIRRNPDLFDVFYPFNYVDCWLESGRSIVPAAALNRHKNRPLIPSEASDYTAFRPPDPNATYIIGADPAGHGRDHSAFQVIEVWDDEWVQVAEYGANCDPVDFGRILLKTALHYNNAMVAIERNGVGLGAITYMRSQNYPNLYWDKLGKPGVYKHSHDQMMAALIDALLDRLTLFGSDTVRQLGSYSADRLVERPLATQIMHGTGPGRRERHHWDKVSALSIACIAAKHAPRRYKVRRDETEAVTSATMSMEQWERYLKESQPASRSRRGYLVRRK